jgi:hypothetical protein
MLNEIKVLFKIKLIYFRQFWSLIQLGIIGSSIGSIGVYFWRFQETNGYVYINLQLAVYINNILTYLLGFCCFFGIIKFLHLCRFNHRLLFKLTKIFVEILGLKKKSGS